MDGYFLRPAQFGLAELDVVWKNMLVWISACLSREQKISTMTLRVLPLRSLSSLTATPNNCHVWAFALIVGCSFFGLQPFDRQAISADSQVDDQDIPKLVRDLDSDRFLNRELATERLIMAGSASIDAIVQALATNNLEVTTRGVYILQELAMQTDLATSEAARAALEKVAAPRVTSAARRAAEALARLDVVRHERALEDLKRLGAVVGEQQSPLGLQIIEQLSIEIGEQWRGTPPDLMRLRWLNTVDVLIVNHPEFDDDALAHVAKMPALPSLTIRKAKITDRGIDSLRQLKNLRSLSVLYCPISDAAVESLGALGGLANLRLYGTSLTAEGKDRLVQSLRGTRVDVRGGAFLGIGCDPTQPGCVIYTVRPDTAAEEAGLQIGDLIEKYEGQPVQNFEELTAAIARNAPGDVVSLQIVRGDEALTKRLKLGDWEQIE